MLHRGCELPGDLAYDVERDVWARFEPGGYPFPPTPDDLSVIRGELRAVDFTR